MTVKELYEWAAKNNAENFDIEIVCRKQEMFDNGVDDCNCHHIFKRHHEYNTEKVVLL